MLIQTIPGLLPLVPDLGTTSIQFLQETPQVDVEDLEISVPNEIRLALVTLKERLVVDGRRQGVSLGHIGQFLVTVEITRPFLYPYTANHAVGQRLCPQFIQLQDILLLFSSP